MSRSRHETGVYLSRRRATAGAGSEAGTRPIPIVDEPEDAAPQTASARGSAAVLAPPAEGPGGEPSAHGAGARLTPWRPGPGASSVAPGAAEARSPEEEREAVLEAARAQGRAEGRAELQAQRDRMALLCRSLRGLQQRSLDWLASAALEAAMAVIEAWLEASEPDRRARLRPILERWVRDVGAGAVASARVAEVDAQAWRELVDQLPIALQVDPALAPGDVRIRSERAMLELRWRDRLAELRGELLAVMPEVPALPADGLPPGDPAALPDCELPLPTEERADFGATQRWRRVPR